MKNKKASEIVTSKLVIIVLAVIVILAVLLLIFRADIMGQLRGLPGYTYPKEDVEIFPSADELISLGCEVPIAGIGSEQRGSVLGINERHFAFYNLEKKNFEWLPYFYWSGKNEEELQIKFTEKTWNFDELSADKVVGEVLKGVIKINPEFFGQKFITIDGLNEEKRIEILRKLNNAKLLSGTHIFCKTKAQEEGERAENSKKVTKEVKIFFDNEDYNNLITIERKINGQTRFIVKRNDIDCLNPRTNPIELKFDVGLLDLGDIKVSFVWDSKAKIALARNYPGEMFYSLKDVKKEYFIDKKGIKIDDSDYQEVLKILSAENYEDFVNKINVCGDPFKTITITGIQCLESPSKNGIISLIKEKITKERNYGVWLNGGECIGNNPKFECNIFNKVEDCSYNNELSGFCFNNAEEKKCRTTCFCPSDYQTGDILNFKIGNQCWEFKFNREKGNYEKKCFDSQDIGAGEGAKIYRESNCADCLKGDKTWKTVTI